MDKKASLPITIYFLFLGFFAFSRIGEYVLTNMLHLRFYLIEIFFIPYICWNFKRIAYCTDRFINTVLGVSLFALSIWDVVFGCIYTFDPLNVITMSRAMIYIFLVYGIYIKRNDCDIYHIKLIAYASVLGELYYGLVLAGYGELRAVNILSLALAIIIPVVEGKLGISILFGGLGFIVALSSGYRIGVVLIALVILEMGAWSFFNKRTDLNTRQVIVRAFFLIVIVLSFSLVFNYYETILEWVASTFGLSGYIYYRLFNRMKSLFALDFSQSQDVSRFAAYRTVAEEFVPRIIPRGLVGKSLGRTGWYIDTPILWLYDVFGSIGAYVIAFVMIIKGAKSFVSSFISKNTEYITVCGLMFPVFLFCFFINGSFLYFTYECIMTGYFLAGWSNYKNMQREFP